MTTVNLKKNADGSVTETVKLIDPDLAHSMRVQAFETLFPDHQNPQKVLPIEEMDVFILDTDQERTSKFVHVGRYRSDTHSFDSDGGWFERIEVERWAYVPNIENENLRT